MALTLTPQDQLPSAHALPAPGDYKAKHGFDSFRFDSYTGSGSSGMAYGDAASLSPASGKSGKSTLTAASVNSINLKETFSGLQSRVIPWEELTVKDLLGTGSFGNVHICAHKMSVYAIKMLPKEERSGPEVRPCRSRATPNMAGD